MRSPWARPPWPRHRRIESRGKLFFRFVALFGFITFLVLASIGVLALLFLFFRTPSLLPSIPELEPRLPGGLGHVPLLVIVLVGGCGLSLVLPLLALGLAARAFKNIATPLADVMAAADAVAEGDLSARVSNDIAGGFGDLAKSFNRMAEELERADQRRRNLTADVAHELRTPLHIIQGNLEGILDGVYEPAEEHIEATLDETRALARLVDDLRTLSLAEAGQLSLVWEPVDVAELLADVGTSFGGQAEAMGIDLRILAEPLPQDRQLIGDLGRLDQVLCNLVTNALRHTPAGGMVTLSAESIDSGIRINVQDTGEGIPAEELPYIFDRFWKGDRSRSHVGGAGSGLGLAIARQLVRAHGGRITAESEPGLGTKMIVELPFSE